MMDWMFEIQDVNETTIDEKLREDGIDISSDAFFPESPAPSTWALQALPSFFTGATPMPAKKTTQIRTLPRIQMQQQQSQQPQQRQPTIEPLDEYAEEPAPPPTSRKLDYRRASTNHATQSLRQTVLRNLAEQQQSGKENINPQLRVNAASFGSTLKSQSRDVSSGNAIPQAYTAIETPTRRSKDGQLPGILRTPGTATIKKVVKFAHAGASSSTDDNTSRDATVTQSRIRSGLPRNFPGKFPSPWTPKSVIDRLDLAESPSVVYSGRAELRDNASKQGEEVPMTRFEINTRSAGIINSMVPPAREDDAAPSTGAAEPATGKDKLKRMEFIISAVNSNNEQLERLFVQQKLGAIEAAKRKSLTPVTTPTTTTVSTTDDNAPNDAAYWRAKYETAEHERLQLAGLLDDVRKHMDSVTKFAEDRDHAVTDLTRQLAVEAQLRRETTYLVKGLAMEMRDLKAKAAEVNGRRLRAMYRSQR
ncbi:uncharacterized protein V1518DRAFT_425301 [Limtongia smithiae]|uniref:uncharacterized protein n=1 Tax=Limtongia smithiae TaxID=1125753 RepID=UPI0034CD533F